MNIEIFNVVLFAVVWIAGSIIVISLVASVLVKILLKALIAIFNLVINYQIHPGQNVPGVFLSYIRI